MSDIALQELNNANEELKKVTKLSNEKLQKAASDSRQKILDFNESSLKKLKESNEVLKNTTEEAKDKIQASKDLIEKQDQEKMEGEAKAKAIIEKINSMCENKDSKVEAIDTKLKELDDDLKKHVVNYESIDKKVEEFKKSVKDQEEEIDTTLKDELKDTKTEDEVDKIEEKLDSMEIYADNKDLKEDLKDAIKLKRDKLEDQAIIEEIKGLIDKEAENNEKYKTEEATRGDETKLMSEWDKLAIEKIVEADFGPRPNKSSEEPLSMIEEVIKELKKMDDYINGEIVKLGVLDYDLSPIGVKIVREYIEEQKPNKILNNATKEEKKKKSVIEKNNEHNIDMINLLLGGILTQDFKDLINSKKKEDIKRLSNEITEYLDQVIEFVKVIDDDKIGEGVVSVLEKIEQRKSSFGLSKEIILNIQQNLRKLGSKTQQILTAHRTAEYILKNLTEEKAKEFFESLTNLLKGKDMKKRKNLLNGLQNPNYLRLSRAVASTFSSQKHILLKDDAGEKFEIFEEVATGSIWTTKPKRIIHTLFLLDFCFKDGKIKKDKGNLDFKSSKLSAILEKVQKGLDEDKMEKEIDIENIELDERLFEKIQKWHIKKYAEIAAKRRKLPNNNEINIEWVHHTEIHSIIFTMNNERNTNAVGTENWNENSQKLLKKLKDEDILEAFSGNISSGNKLKNWMKKREENKTEKKYIQIESNTNYFKILNEVMEEYFVKDEETGKWKLQGQSLDQYKAIIKYLENPKYIIKDGNNKISEIVKCCAVLKKLSTKYKKEYESVLQKFLENVSSDGVLEEPERFEYEFKDNDIKQKKEGEEDKFEEFDVIENNQENLLSWEKDKWTIDPGYKGKLTREIEIEDPRSLIEDQMKEIKEQLTLKANYLNSIIDKYKNKKNPEKGYTKSNESNQGNKLPLPRVQVYKINNFIKEFKTSKDIDTIAPKVVHTEREGGLSSHRKLASNLKKLNIRKKKDYSSFNEIPTDYSIVGVKNEVSEKLYEKLEKIKDNKKFGKSRRKNKFGQSGDDVDIKKTRAEASDELIDIINEELGENLIGKLFKPTIDEQRVKELIQAIPNERLQVKMKKKLDKKMKNTQPASLEDLNRKINKDTKELTNNTNKIYDKVKNLVDRINKKDKRIIQLKNEIERERSIGITKLTNNKETFELNRKRIEKDLNRRNAELENIKIDQEKKTLRLFRIFNNAQISDKNKLAECLKALNEAKVNNVKEIDNLRESIRKDYDRKLANHFRSIKLKHDQELQLERNKLAAAEKKAEEKIKAQVAKALQTKKEYENVLRNQQRKYTKLTEQAEKQCSERNNKIDEVCKQKVVELKTDYKNFEKRVGRIFDKQKQDNERKIKKIEEEAGKEVQKGSEESKSKVNAYREEIKRLKGIANELSNRQKEALGKGIERRESKIKYLEELAVKNKEISSQKLTMTQKQLRDDFKNTKDEMRKKLQSGIELNRQKSLLETQANTMKIQKDANNQVEQIKDNLENEVDKIEENAQERINKAEAETDKIKEEAKKELDKKLADLQSREDSLLKQFNEELNKAKNESQGEANEFKKLEVQLREKLEKEKDIIKKQKEELYQKKVDTELEIVEEKNKLKQELRDAQDKVTTRGIEQSEKLLQQDFDNKVLDLNEKFDYEKKTEEEIEEGKRKLEEEQKEKEELKNKFEEKEELFKKEQEEKEELLKKEKEEKEELFKKEKELLKKQQEEKYKLFKKEQEESNTVKLEQVDKVPKQNIIDNLKERMKKFTKGFNLFKTEIKDGKTVTFKTWVTTNKIPEETAFNFEMFHRARIAGLVKQAKSSVDSTLEFNDPKEIVKSWIMFNMKKAGKIVDKNSKKAGKFVKKNSKKIAAVAAVTGAVVAGTKAVKRRRKTSPKRKKRSTSRRRKTSPKRKTSPRRKTSPKRKKRGTSPKRKRKTSPRRRKKKTTTQAAKLLKDVRKILKA